MRIQHNIMALNAYRQLGGNNSALAKNLEKLSSGYKINRAGDDAAGLAISEKMRAQIKGLEAAQKNANDGISLVQTAEGALTEVHSMLNRMVYLATQSANGTYDDPVDRANLDKEVQTLMDEIDRISKSTNFNGINLLDGSMNEAQGVEFGQLESTTTEATEGTQIESGYTGTATKVENGHLAGGAGQAQEDYFFMSKNLQATGYDNAGTGTASTTAMQITLSDGGTGSNTLTFSVTSSTTDGDTTSVDMKAILDAFKADTTNGGTLTVGGATVTVAAAGTGDLNTIAKIKEKYDFSYDEDKLELTVTAKEVGTGYGATGVAVTNANTATTGDIAAMQGSLRADYADAVTGTGEPDSVGAVVTLGNQSKESVHGENAATDPYKLASATFEFGAANTLHGKAITVDGQTYLMKDTSSATELDEDLLKHAEDNNWTVVEFDSTVTSTTNNSNAMVALAHAVNGNTETNADLEAKVVDGTHIQFAETREFQQKVVDGDEDAIAKIHDDMASLVSGAPGGKDKYGASEATTTPGNTTITLSADDLVAGTRIVIGEGDDAKTYEFTNDEKNLDPGVIGVKFKEGDAAANAAALAEAIGDGASAAEGVVDLGKVMEVGKDIQATTKGLVLQVGDTAAYYQKVGVKIADMSTSGLGLDGLKISDYESATSAIDRIKNAINTVSSTRGDLGAVQNRLEHTINNLGVQTENITAAESRIRDTDMAEEMMAYTKNNILVQAAQAMLAQANQVPQGILQLLQ